MELGPALEKLPDDLVGAAFTCCTLWRQSCVLDNACCEEAEDGGVEAAFGSFGLSKGPLNEIG